MEKINLNRIKVAIFDFDDTLAIHKDRDYVRRRKESEEYYLNYYLNAYLNPETFYDKIEPCTMTESLYKFIKYLKDNNVKMYCVSGTKFSFHLKSKQYFINKYYDEDIEVISTASQDLKSDAIKIFSIMHNCNLDEILFVDDTKENIEKFRNMGINAVFPEDIENLFLK